MPVEVKPDIAQLRRLMNTPKLQKKLTRIVRRAVSSAGRDMKAEAKKRVRARKRLKAGDVSRAMTVRKVGQTLDDIDVRLVVSGKPVPLSRYPGVRQTRKGVTAGINKGKRSLIESAFIATMSSGHKGVFIRRGAKRLPIDEQFGSRPVDALLHPGEAAAVQRRGAVSFNATVSRLIATL